MTKKDYQMLAKVVREWKADILMNHSMNERAVEKLMVRLCNALKADNSRFDEDKFYEAVYKSGTK